jgi:cephalosporin hydroxylase
MDISCRKFVSDLWNYQEILWKLQPSVVFEAGVFEGGTTLFFSHALSRVGHRYRVLGVDISLSNVKMLTRRDPNIELMACSSVDPRVAYRLESLRAEYPGPMFVILDSDHQKDHVYAEMMMLRDILCAGDYLIVEDTIIGNPILPNFGPGPFEALNEYIKTYPDDYVRDEEREKKFGITAAPSGYLIRR